MTETAITFEVDVPTVQEFESRITKTRLNFLIWSQKWMEKVVGYAMPRPIMRAAYDWTTELSIYVAKKKRVDKGLDRPFIRP